MPKAAKQQYIRDKKTIESIQMKHLAAKVTIGGSVGSGAMARLSQRDFEMNKDAYLEAKKERETIRAKKHGTCNLCGGWKQPAFRICGKCHLLKASNATKMKPIKLWTVVWTDDGKKEYGVLNNANPIICLDDTDLNINVKMNRSKIGRPKIRLATVYPLFSSKKESEAYRQNNRDFKSIKVNISNAN